MNVKLSAISDSIECDTAVTTCSFGLNASTKVEETVKLVFPVGVHAFGLDNVRPTPDVSYLTTFGSPTRAGLITIEEASSNACSAGQTCIVLDVYIDLIQRLDFLRLNRIKGHEFKL